MHLIVIFGVLVSILVSLFYAFQTLVGKVKPNKVTWLIWGCAPIISSIASFTAGAFWPILPVFAAGIGPCLIFFASFFNRESYWKMERFDWICGITSLIALFLWYITKNPNIAITLSIVSDFLAALPTLIKGWKFPHTENEFVFLGSLISSSTSFTQIHNITFTNMAFSIYLMMISLILFIVVALRKKFIG